MARKRTSNMGKTVNFQHATTYKKYRQNLNSAPTISNKSAGSHRSRYRGIRKAMGLSTG